MELKELVESSEMTERMNYAFSDLRADYELDLGASQEKIEELCETNVDIENHLQNLITYSSNSSGVVSGLRGTGKTHLMLLARNLINKRFIEDSSRGSFCVYLNVKRLNVPLCNGNDDIFNRVFSIFLYDEIATQLKALLEQFNEGSRLEKFLKKFSLGQRKRISDIENALKKLQEFKVIARVGTNSLAGLSLGTITEEDYAADLISIGASIDQECSAIGITSNIGLSQTALTEISTRVQNTQDIMRFLNHREVRQQLLEIMNLLGIKSLAVFVDEWEKLYHEENVQKWMATYINRIIDQPIYFWLGVVPNRGGYSPLALGADLQHFINLDDALIYENSTNGRSKCLNYFTQFINKRLEYFFKDTEYADVISVDTLFNKKENLDLLVLASMGNSRDFGTMLLDCWDEFQSERKAAHQHVGRPYKYISNNMVIAAIKRNGEKKKNNITDGTDCDILWKSIESFCIDKKSSHFVIEEGECRDRFLATPYFSELIYHRLVHFRKAGLTQKDGHGEALVSLYALDYASVYDLHAVNRKMEFIKDSDKVHNSVRRYVYDPRPIIDRIEIKRGSAFPCKSCHEMIAPAKMKAAWDANTCPFCGGEIH